MKIPLIAVGALSVLLLGAAALAKEPGSTRVETELMAAPYRDAKSAGKLAANTAVTVIERRGAWVRVVGADRDGWARLHQVRLGEGTEQKGSSGLTALWNVGTTGRSGSQGIVATTGIRGMSAEQLKGAKPNPDEVKTLERYRASDEQARELARTGGLREKDIAALPKPE
jgi:hypothetical protein